MKKLGHESEPLAEQLPPIEIHFGDIFISMHNPSKKYLITDVGEDDWCVSAKILIEKDTLSLGLSGSTTRGDISKIIDHWDLQKILDAVMVHYGHRMPEDNFYTIFRENSKQKPRLFTL